ncbi:CsgG/HfaB family protein [Myxosarcina sp. GI1]|uniref:CsgG/HfaB family protein n=1 Tax=Myxosarcina sp. GI1 TaxID=1541065 RepID=UPI00068FE22A|nr:CsgG/HfaB family protein [Myxosarcina sp. GI1]
MRHFSGLSKHILLNRNVISITVVALSFNLVNLPVTQAFESNNKFNASPLIIAQNQEKLKVAVLDFDFSSVSDPGLLSIFSGGSKGVSDILVNKLVLNDNYKVIERSQIDAVLREQNLGASGRVDASSAAKIGQILGVQAVIIGSVTQFDLEQKNSGVNVFGIGTGGKKTNAYVRLNVRVIDTNTAEIIMVADGAGTANQSDKSINILGVSSSSNTSNEGKLLTVATDQAVDEVVKSLDANSAKLATSRTTNSTVPALVADISGSTVVLNKGTVNGYKPGMKLTIERVSKEIKDPETGTVIRRLTETIGTIELLEVDNSSSIAKVISGSEFEIGDIAKPSN